MDIFTLCFSYPSGYCRILGPSSTWTPVFHPSDINLVRSATGDDDTILSPQQHLDAEFEYVFPSASADAEHEEFEQVHQKCLAISGRTGCLVSAVKDSSAERKGTGEPSAWKFQLSGGYTQVMDARRIIMGEFKPSVKTTVRIPAIHVLQSIHSPAPAATPLHPVHDVAPATPQPAISIKADVRAKLSSIQERTGAKVEVKMVQGRRNSLVSAHANVPDPTPSKDAFGFGSVSSQPPHAAWISSKPPPTTSAITPSSTSALKVSDSGRSKSMYPILPTHVAMPQVHEHASFAEHGITRTDSPEMMGSTAPHHVQMTSPEPLVSPLPLPPSKDPLGTTDPWSATRSKTFDVAQRTAPRVAGIKSPVMSSGANVPLGMESPPGTASSAVDEDALVDELKVWGFAEEKVCVVVIEGREECVRAARVLILVLIDELNGLAQDVCEIDHRIQYILAGRKRQTVNAIQEETNTNIYLAPTTSTTFLDYPALQVDNPASHIPTGATHLSSPILGVETHFGFPISPIPTPGRGTLDVSHHAPPFSGQPSAALRSAPLSASPRPTDPSADDGLQDSIARLCIASNGGNQHDDGSSAYVGSLLEMRSRVYVTGDAVGVMNAKEMLSRLAFSKKQSLFTKEAAVVPRKLDWIVAEKQKEISRIMHDNGSYVEMIPGPQAGVVKVYGDHRISVERTMKHVMMLFAELTLATVFTMAPPSLSDHTGFDASLESVLKLAASSTKAEVAYRAGQFQVCGTLTEVRKCLPVILTSNAVKNTTHEIRFQCELAVEHRDFMAGKRNGKITKITRATGCQIKFDQFNNQNFLIDVNGAGLKVLEALDLINDELPAEISFHIPESYHRRIIGKGGASVQDVMRRHSAFVKFSSTDQWAAFGGHHHNEDNVICITPNKNKQGLYDMKQDLMMSILTKDRDYDDWVINIDRKYHRALQAETRAYLHHIEVVHGANIRFLPREDGQDAIEVFASKYQAKVIRDLLSKVLPVELTCSFHINIELAKVAASSEWLAFTTDTLQDLQVSILPYSQLVAGGESIFVLKCQRQNLVRLKEARARLDMFLRSQPKYAEPFEWSYGLMTSRSETNEAHGHRRGLSTVVYGSEQLGHGDLPKSAGLRRADTVGGQYLDGWRAKKAMHKRSETEDGRIEYGNYPPPIAPPIARPEPEQMPNPAKTSKGIGGRTQSLDIRNMNDFSGGHSRHASFASLEQAYYQAGGAANDSNQPTATLPVGTSTFPRYKAGAYPRRGVSVYDAVQE